MTLYKSYGNRPFEFGACHSTHHNNLKKPMTDNSFD